MALFQLCGTETYKADALYMENFCGCNFAVEVIKSEGLLS